MSERGPCSVDGCDTPWAARGMCQKHYLRWKKHGDANYVRPPRVCATEGCDRPSDWRGRCKKHSKGPTEQSWLAMRRRVTSPNAPDYALYGGRGITIDPRWQSFEAFLADMGERPEGHTLDRIDNNGNYEPGNCRWATHTQQLRNRRNVKLSMDAAREIRRRAAEGETQVALARDFNVGREHICMVIHERIWREG